ncbi:transglutaminase domain-containing protein [Bilifractor sp. LCP19S3_H10]|uniref:transglutaminase domain-containing protein n=1 Tax=Bilifractor sp. LCP19S3_H10 TaxID=3438736 RepID=UPI003F9173C0
MKKKFFVQSIMAITTIGMLFTALPVLAEDVVPSAVSSVSVSSSANETEESVTAGSGSGTGGSTSAKEDFSRTTEAGSNPSETKETSEKSEEEIEEGEEDAQKMPVVSYAAHVQRTGWPDKEVISGETTQTYAGSTGRGLRVEAIRASVKGDQNLGITYNTYVQRNGWTGSQSNGAVAGTTGQSLRVEAIVMQLTGTDADKYDLYYRVHVQSFGWLAWAKNGEVAGTTNLSRRIEAYEVALVKKDEAAPARSASRNVAYLTIPTVTYQTHVQRYGWGQGEVSNGALSGTTGQGLRMEALKIHLDNTTGFTGGISYCAHIQRFGWEQNWKSDGVMTGTVGKGLRLETVRIRLTGEMANCFDVYYRTHVQRFGWTGWASNGADCGSAGYGYRLEAIEIRIVAKGSGVPGSTANTFHQYTVRDAYPLACARLDQIGWNLRAAYNWARNFRYISMDIPSSRGARYFATLAFTNQSGDCYGKSASFYEMAKALGYDAHWVVGYVAASGGGREEHGWVEIDNYNGGTHVFDPSFEQGVHKNGFAITYGQKGTWKYLDYSRQN